MGWFANTFSFSVGRKLLMSLTGLFIAFFLIIHLSGNFMLFANDGGKMFNSYAYFMTHHIVFSKIIKLIEILLLAAFLVHIIDGIALWLKNRKARAVNYRSMGRPKGISPLGRLMIVSGLLMLLFLIIHLANFFVPYHVTGAIGRTELYDHVAAAFARPWYSILYIVCMFALAAHLHHGVRSGFQTIGLRHPKYWPLIKGIGYFFAYFVSAGFAAMPLYFLLKALA